jgi:tetratricopeptide (TPR) repeat protein
MSLATPDDLNAFATTESSRRLLPRLVARMLGSEPGVVGVDMPTGVWRPGWDGVVTDAPGSDFIPSGQSAWELSNAKSPAAAADENMRKRTLDSEGLDPMDTTFVFVTMRHWKSKRSWQQKALAGGDWKNVAVRDSEDLFRWLEANPTIHRWVTKHVRAASCTRPPTNIPLDVSNFVGRSAELEKIQSMAASMSSPRAGVIWGPPGSGKTSLAVRAGHALAEFFPDGCYWVEAGSATSDDACALQRAVLRRLGYADEDMPRDPVHVAETYRAETADRILLIILDNASTEAQVRALLPGGTDSLLLTTSRSRLAGLDDAIRIEAVSLSPSEGVQVLSRYRDTPLAGHDLDAAHRLVRLCDGLPLALQIAARMAARRPAWSLDHLADRLASETDRISRLHVGDIAVRSVFASAYDTLPEPQKRAFRRASALPGTTFTAALLRAADGDVLDVEEVLDDLIDQALVVSDSRPGLYRIHDLLRLFGREKFATEEVSAQQEQVETRVARWLLEGATATHHVVWVPPTMPGVEMPEASFDARQALVWWDTHYANLMALVEKFHAARDYNVALTALITIASYCELRRFWNDLEHLAVIGRRALEAVAAKGTANPPVFDRVNFAVTLIESKTASGLRDFDQALELTDQAHRLAATSGDRSQQGHALLMRSQVLRSTGRHEEALDAISEAQAFFAQADDEHGRNLTLHNLGALLNDVGNPSAGIDHLVRELAECKKRGDLLGAAHTMNTLALAKMRLGKINEAEVLLRDCIEICRDHNDIARAGDALNDLGLLLYAKGDFDEAQQCHLEDAVYCQHLADNLGKQKALLRVAHTFLETAPNRVRDSLKIIRACAEYALDNGERDLQAATLMVLGEFGYVTGNYDHADGNYSEGARIYQSIGSINALVDTRIIQLRRASVAKRTTLIEPIIRELIDDADAIGPFQQARLIAELIQARRLEGIEDSEIELMDRVTALVPSLGLTMEDLLD